MTLSIVCALLTITLVSDDPVGGDESPAVLYRRATDLMADGKFVDGKRILVRLSRINHRDLPHADSPNARFVRDLVAVSSAKQLEGNPPGALDDATIAVQAAEKLFADEAIDAVDFAHALGQQANAIHAVRRDASARPIIEKALALVEGSGSTSLELLLAGELVEVLVFEGNLIAARNVAMQMLEGKSQPNSASSSRGNRILLIRQVLQLSRIHSEMGLNAESLRLTELALSQAQDLFPQQDFPNGHTILADALRRRGEVHSNIGELSKADKDLTLALGIYESLFKSGYGLESDVKQCMKSLGIVRYRMGEYAAATEIFERLRRKHIEYGNARHSADPYYALVLNNLAACYDANGRLSDAISCFREALIVFEEAFVGTPEGHELTVVCLRNLGCVHRKMGAYEKALSYFDDALRRVRRLENASQSSSQITRELLQDIGLQHWLQGQVNTAAVYVSDALDINRRKFNVHDWPRGHVDLQLNLVHWARVLQRRGELNDAHATVNDALVMAEALFPVADFPLGHDAIVNTLCHIGDVETDRKRFASSREYLMRALRMHEALHPENNPAAIKVSASIHALIGRSFERQGQLADARATMQLALRLRQQAHATGNSGIDHPEIVKAIREIAIIDWRRGARDDAFDALVDAARREHRMIVHFCSGASEAQTLNFASERLMTLDFLLSVWKPEAYPTEQLYPHLWSRHGLVFQLTALKQQHARELEDVSQAYFDARKKLARQAAGPRDFLALDDKRLQTLSDAKERTEADLSRLVGRLDEANQNSHIKCRQLVDALSPEDAFLDVSHFVRYEFDGDRLRNTRSLGVFVLQHGKGIQFADLGPAEPIEAAIGDWMKDIASGRDTLKSGRLVRDLVWAPIRECLGRHQRRLFIAPEGVLASIPWAAIPAATAGSFLVEQYELDFVLNGRFLLDSLKNPVPKQIEHVVAVGAVKYGAPESESKTPFWTELPASSHEIEQLNRLVAPRQIDILTGSDATTAAFAAATQQATAIHIATHGFVGKGIEASVFQPVARQYEQQRRRIPGERVTVQGRNPLLLCGLVFAGANRTVDQSAYLTGEDIAALRLDGTTLAFLSACETGIGDQQRGEGVFSLQRAFHLAGARNVIASLWRVDDEATSELVGQFYRSRLVEGATAGEALRAAQLAMLKSPTDRNRVDRGIGRKSTKLLSGTSTQRRVTPERDWAGFVLSGTGR